jgi:hypothetical protein
MFMTYPHFEQAMPAGLGPAQSRYWRAIELSLSMPWTVVTLTEKDREGKYERTLLLSNPADLGAMIESRPAGSITGIRQVNHGTPLGSGSGWQMMNVRKIWRLDVQDGSGHEVLVYEDDAGQLIDEFGTASTAEQTRRHLLVEVPAPAGGKRKPKGRGSDRKESSD